MPIPSDIQREHVLKACEMIDAGQAEEFAKSTRYDLRVNGKTYPPKAVISLAAKLATGRPFSVNEFNGGQSPGSANPFLRRLGFEIVDKSGAIVDGSGIRMVEFTPTKPKSLISAIRVPYRLIHQISRKVDETPINLRLCMKAGGASEPFCW